MAAYRLRRAAATESGAALLVVLLFLVAFGGSSAMFIRFMNQQQARAGARLRDAAASALAEAGVHRALVVLESVTPDNRKPGRTWRPAAYSELLSAGPLPGRFTVSIDDASDGGVVVTSVGEAAGVTRRVRARVSLTSPALLTALYATSVIRLEDPPAATYVLPYLSDMRDRPWVHAAAGREIWFATSSVSVNDPETPFEVAPGPVDRPEVPGRALRPPRPGPIRLLLARGAELTVTQAHQRVAIDQLRSLGIHLEGVVHHTEALPELPEVDRGYYRLRAAGNTANARLNAAAGKYAGNQDLERKRDSLYASTEFAQIQDYLRAGLHRPRMTGIVYVRGGLVLSEGGRLEIADGTLIAEGTVYIKPRAQLEVTHTAATRLLPGLMVLDNGSLIVAEGATLRVHGLVLTSRVFDVLEGARVDIVGSVLAGDRGLSFRNTAARVVIRYDPAVLGTPGLAAAPDGPVIAWIASWEDSP